MLISDWSLETTQEKQAGMDASHLKSVLVQVMA